MCFNSSDSFHSLFSLGWVHGKCTASPGAMVTNPACWSESPRKLFILFYFILGLCLWHMGVPRLGVESKL